MSKLYYESSLIFLLGSNNNKICRQKSLVVFDDNSKAKIAEIKLKYNIINFHITKNLIILEIKHKFLFFDIKQVKLLFTLKNYNKSSFPKNSTHSAFSYHKNIFYFANFNCKDIVDNSFIYLTRCIFF